MAGPVIIQLGGGGARGMKLIATGLLVAMAALYLVARAYEPLHPAIGYLKAFAEAAMVGGLADWFAVTALFRHPLGLPIPHTAIIPRNKDRIGDTLALFLRDNFLTPAVVARRMARLDIAGAVARFLTRQGAGDGRLKRGASRLIADILAALDEEKFGGTIRDAAEKRLREVNVAPIAGQALAAAIAQDRHRPLIDGLVRWGGKTLSSNEPLLRQMVRERAGAILRWTGLDDTLADKIIEGLQKLLVDMGNDPAHPLRAKAEEGLAHFAIALQDDPELQDKVSRWRDEVLDNPAMRRWLEGLWEQARGALLRAARDPDAVLAGKLGDMLRAMGESLTADPRLSIALNRFARRAAVGLTATYGDGIVRLVSDTVRGWDAQTITGRLENAVGRDLQYIRVNGTLVGGSVGLLLHWLEGWL